METDFPPKKEFWLGFGSKAAVALSLQPLPGFLQTFLTFYNWHDLISFLSIDNSKCHVWVCHLHLSVSLRFVMTSIDAMSLSWPLILKVNIHKSLFGCQSSRPWQGPLHQGNCFMTLWQQCSVKKMKKITQLDLFPWISSKKRISWLLGLQRDFTTISKWQICKVCWILCILFIVQNLKIYNNENSVRILIFGTEGFWSWLSSVSWVAESKCLCQWEEQSGFRNEISNVKQKREFDNKLKEEDFVMS